jgi:hypothetical protein
MIQTTTTQIETKTLVISLIKEDLRCNKLVLGLSGLGLDAGRYHTELSTVIFQLLDIDHNNDQLLQLYFDCVDKAATIKDVEDGKQLLAMAEKIFERLLQESGCGSRTV